MELITEKLLNVVSDWTGTFAGAYNIRENGQCAGRSVTENIDIITKTDKPGIDIKIKPNTKKETVSIPACVTKGDIDDLVYNDFYVGENSDIVIVAGCGVHTDTHETARHNGIHRFFLSKNSHVVYKEKHIGTGEGDGTRSIDQVTEAFLEEGAVLEIESVQIKGVDSTNRKTKAVVGKDAKLIIRESLMTDGNQVANTEFEVELNGENSGTDLVSRSVAKGCSKQNYRSRIIGNAACTGHSECDAIIADKATVNAAPELTAANPDAQLIHEAAIGKIAGEQILKLMTLGLTEQEAENIIIEGFLK